VKCVVLRAMAEAGGFLRLGENVGLAVVSEKQLANYTLHPEEVRILAPRACRRKRVEFALGRTAANLALKQVGLENPGPVLRASSGEPLWPDGIVGSITHRYPWSVAVVINGSNRFAIGVDLEAIEGLQGTDISQLVCRQPELDWVHLGNFQERLAMIFSAKEAFYKAFYPLCRRYIDFKEVELVWSADPNRLQGKFSAPLGPNRSWGETCAVHSVRCGHFIFSFVIHALNGGK
jgi:4'-phosphopantetheinyl transferase EntD